MVVEWLTLAHDEEVSHWTCCNIAVSPWSWYSNQTTSPCWHSSLPGAPVSFHCGHFSGWAAVRWRDTFLAHVRPYVWSPKLKRQKEAALKRSSFISSDVARVWVLRQLSGPASRFLDLPVCLAEVRFFSWAKDALQVLQLVKSHTVHMNAWDSDLINWGTIIHTSEDTATVWLENITQRPSYFGSRIFWLCKYLFIGLDGSSLRERIGRGQELTQLLLDEI